ncbi:MAG: hypothetical protein WCK15_20075 [Pirellula sp.]
MNNLPEKHEPLPSIRIVSVNAYETALKRASLLFSARRGTPEGVELDSLIDEIVSYEKEHFPFEISGKIK